MKRHLIPFLIFLVFTFYAFISFQCGGSEINAVMNLDSIKKDSSAASVAISLRSNRFQVALDKWCQTTDNIEDSRILLELMRKDTADLYRKIKMIEDSIERCQKSIFLVRDSVLVRDLADTLSYRETVINRQNTPLCDSKILIAFKDSLVCRLDSITDLLNFEGKNLEVRKQKLQESELAPRCHHGQSSRTARCHRSA